MDRSAALIAQLTPDAGAAAITLLNAVRAAGIPLVVSSGLRSVAEQQRLVAAGRSRTLRSAHLDGRAFDVDVLGFSRDDIPEWFWQQLGPYGESLGLTWGGRWSNPYDPGHFEI